MGLTSRAFAGLLLGLTILLPVLAVGGVRRRTEAEGEPSWRLGVRPQPTRWGAVRRWLLIVCAQVLAILTVLVIANRQFGFYQRWGDLIGVGPSAVKVTPNGPDAGHPHQAGSDARPLATQTSRSRTRHGAQLVTLHVTGRASGVAADVLVWLPPQYQAPDLADRRFPVLMMFPGQPGSPQGVFNQFDFDRVGSEAILRGHAAPFVAVFPPIMTHPPRDTECVDVPGGPQSQTWLVDDVRRAVLDNFRVAEQPQQGFLAGYSTGGFCAANLLLRHRDKFGAAASLGGYFHPWVDAREPDLFGGDENLRRANSPIWQFEHTEPRPTRLLIATSTRDRQTWDGPAYSDGDSRKMIELARRWPGTATILVEQGGHGFRSYLHALPEALRWMGASGL